MAHAKGWSIRTGDQSSSHYASDHAKFYEAWKLVSARDIADRSNSTTGLQGLDTTPVNENSPTTLSPVSPKSMPENSKQNEAEIMDEVEEIERLQERVEDLEKQLKREEAEERESTAGSGRGKASASRSGQTRSHAHTSQELVQGLQPRHGNQRQAPKEGQEERWNEESEQHRSARKRTDQI